MIPSRFKLVMNYLTRAKRVKPDLPDVFPASQAPIPEKTLTRDMFKEAQERFKNAKADGGMLVKPSADGSRPGYAKVKSVENIKGKDRTTFLRSPLDKDELSTFKNYLNQRDDINIPDLIKNQN